MKFHTTLKIHPNALTVADRDSITEKIRGLAYPKTEGEVVDGECTWEVEIEGDTLAEVASRYRETQDNVASYCSTNWTADPDDPVEHACNAARDVLEWERHIDGISLPDELRIALEQIVGTDWQEQ